MAANKSKANVFSFSAILLKIDVSLNKTIGTSHSNDLNSVNVNEIESFYWVDTKNTLRFCRKYPTTAGMSSDESA